MSLADPLDIGPKAPLHGMSTSVGLHADTPSLNNVDQQHSHERGRIGVDHMLVLMLSRSAAGAMLDFCVRELCTLGSRVVKEKGVGVCICVPMTFSWLSLRGVLRSPSPECSHSGRFVAHVQKTSDANNYILVTTIAMCALREP